MQPPTIVQTPLRCSICGKLSTHYGMVGKDEALCMSNGEGSCFAWFAGYPYQLMDWRKKEEEKSRPLIQAIMEEEWVNEAQRLHSIYTVMKKVRETLAKYQEFEVLWQVDRLGLFGR